MPGPERAKIILKTAELIKENSDEQKGCHGRGKNGLLMNIALKFTLFISICMSYTVLVGFIDLLTRN
jgi:hypothetical protein